jgi:hypothetical protein
MENDSVRTTGETTLVDMWINGKLRSVAVTRAAIEGCLELLTSESNRLSEDERSEFVRTHLTLVHKAAIERLGHSNASDDMVRIEAGQLQSGRVTSAVVAGERRTGDRRKGERRKMNLGPPGGIERRKT